MKDIELIKGWLTPEWADHHQKWLADSYFNKMIKWEKYIPIGDGKSIKLKRYMAYISSHGSGYEFAGVKLKQQAWTSDYNNLLILKWNLEKDLGIELNSVLLNCYTTGRDEIRWHADKEEQLGDNPIIPCVNLGATRKFWFLEKETGNRFYHEVSHGDLLVMGPECQKKYLHAILKEKEVEQTRFSLTFRKVYDKDSLIEN